MGAGVSDTVASTVGAAVASGGGGELRRRAASSGVGAYRVKIFVLSDVCSGHETLAAKAWASTCEYCIWQCCITASSPDPGGHAREM